MENLTEDTIHTCRIKSADRGASDARRRHPLRASPWHCVARASPLHAVRRVVRLIAAKSDHCSRSSSVARADRRLVSTTQNPTKSYTCMPKKCAAIGLVFPLFLAIEKRSSLDANLAYPPKNTSSWSVLPITRRVSPFAPHSVTVYYM